jgi:lipoprotein-anchoring transpeptidase ErfK/SrfK
MWLEGDEEGFNKGGAVDSYKRYIYIHGTQEEGLIGVKASHGCIRMFNNDVIELYKKVNIGTKVLIKA